MRETGKPRVQRGNIGKREQVMVERSDEGCERVGEDDDEEGSVSDEKRERISKLCTRRTSRWAKPFATDSVADKMSNATGSVMEDSSFPIFLSTTGGGDGGGDRTHFTTWKHTWVHHNRGVVWDTAANTWAGEEDWTTKKEKVGEGRNQE